MNAKVKRRILGGVVLLGVIGFVLMHVGCGAMGKAGTVFNYPMPKASPNGLGFYQPSKTVKDYPVIKGETKNIILLIGDGMGFEQVKLSRLRVMDKSGKLYMERLPVKGEVMTRSSSSSKTDSAAAGTAMACGVKTKNGMIGMGPEGTKYQTILEAAKEEGKRTGLIVTCPINHATPASFASHVKSRNNYAEIARQLVEEKVNVLFGGGGKYYMGKNEEMAKNMGYTIIRTKDELATVSGDHVLGLFADDELISTDISQPSLKEMTVKGLELLNKGTGFFVMIEGSEIDWGGHHNDENVVVRETLQFDMAVKEAMDFATKDKRTLVIVTADHETGGMKIVEKDGQAKASWSTSGHTGVNVPLFAFGPGSERFAGEQDNTEIAIKMAEVSGWGKLPQKK